MVPMKNIDYNNNSSSVHMSSFNRHLLVPLFLLVQVLCHIPGIQSTESVWNQLQDHVKYAHDNHNHNSHNINVQQPQRQEGANTVQQQQAPSQLQSKSDATGGDQIYKYSNLFVDLVVTKTPLPVQSSSISADAVLSGEETTSSSTTAARSTGGGGGGVVGDGMTSMNDGGGGGGGKGRKGMMNMKQIGGTTRAPSPTNVPLGMIIPASRAPTPAEGKGGEMSKKDKDDNNKSPSPSGSAEPTYIEIDSPYPSKAVDGGGGMMSSMKDKSTTPSPSISAEPTYIDMESPYPSKNVDGGGGMMSSSMKDKTTTPSPSISAEPTYIDLDSPYPSKNVDGGGGMMSSMKDKTKTPSPSISAEPTYIESPFPTNAGKGKSKQQTDSPSTTSVPSTTMVPTIAPENHRGMMSMQMNNNDGKENIMMMMTMDGNGKGGGMMRGSSMSPSSSVPSSVTDSPISPASILPTTVLLPPLAPTTPSTSRVQLSPYTLRYTFNQSRIPSTFEVDDVIAVTRMYLADYFEVRYTDITEFITRSTDTLFSLQQPFVINYTSTAVFNTVPSGTIPPMEELDIVLIAAFTTTNLQSYINQLQDLPPENVFRTTSNVTFTIYPMAGNDTDDANSTLRSTDNDGSSNDNRKHGAKGRAAGIAAGTGVFVIAIISITSVLVRKKTNPNGMARIENHDAQPHRRNAKNFNNDDEGHMTVAGDTYMADSTVVSGGTVSILSTRQGRRSRRRFNKRILSQSRELVLVHTEVDEQYVTLPQSTLKLLPPPLDTSPSSSSSPSVLSIRRGVSDGSDNNSHNNHTDNENDLYANDEDDNRSLLPFYTTMPEPAYRGALSVDANERRGGEGRLNDVLLSMRDDMRLPRHFSDEIPDPMLVMHNDIDNNTDNDDDTLSVDDDVPLRVIDLIRKFTPTRRHKSR